MIMYTLFILLNICMLCCCHSNVQHTISSVNCTWQTFEQPLDHFARGIGEDSTFQQRVCIYDEYFKQHKSNREKRPVFFYTGNEATVEIYVNNTGLMWNLAPKYGALLVFAEHRYFGKSIPNLNGLRNCMSYAGSAQALADYANVVTLLKQQYSIPDSKVISFGGSYGGMLAAWFRYKYPHICNGGAIAASAPVVGFAGNHPHLYGGFEAATRGALHNYGNQKTNTCASNILGTWPIMKEFGRHSSGIQILEDVFKPCAPLTSEADVDKLIDYAQQVFFYLGEGNYPFATDYITFSVLGTQIPIGSWPIQRVCSKFQMNELKLSGDKSKVAFDVEVDPNFKVSVDWQSLKSNYDQVNDKTQLKRVLQNMKDGIDVFYNVTGTLKCHPIGSENMQALNKNEVNVKNWTKKFIRGSKEDDYCTKVSTLDPLVAWEAITCNEDINLIQYSVKGTGHDMFWPPTTKSRNYKQQDVIKDLLAGCQTFEARNPGLKGVYKYSNPNAEWPLNLYGGSNVYEIKSKDNQHPGASRIVFSNGLFDPWSAAGVLPKNGKSYIDAEGITALVIEDGAHHNDLFFPTPNDTKDTLVVRKQEEDIIRKWIGLEE